MLKRTVFAKYYNFIKVFLKEALNQLLLYRLYNYKIKLEKDILLEYSSFYKQTTEELKALKQYLVDNLQKSFIKASAALFASLVLFVKKLDRSLQFCINFRTLNDFTRKD